MSGVTGTQAELLFTQPASVTKNTYTTEAAFSGVLGTDKLCKIPAGYFGLDVPNQVGRGLHVLAFGTCATTSAATLAVALGLDPSNGVKTTGIAVAGALAPTVAVTCPWKFEAWYTCTACTDSTCTLQVNGEWKVQSVASGGVPTTSSQNSGFSGTHAGFDPRVVNYIELFGTWSASAAGNTTTLQQMFLWADVLVGS
jgi:hypothetical protein